MVRDAHPLAHAIRDVRRDATDRFGIGVLPPLPGGGNLTCAEGDFRLVGTIGDQAIDLRDSTAGGGYWRIGSPGFDTQASPNHILTGELHNAPGDGVLTPGVKCISQDFIPVIVVPVAGVGVSIQHPVGYIVQGAHC